MARTPPRISSLKPRVQMASLSSLSPVATAGPERYGQGRGGRPWRRKREATLVRDKYCCQRCRRAGRVTLATQVDHVIPVAAGGTDDDANLESICDPCHIEKGAEDAKRYGWTGRPTPGG